MDDTKLREIECQKCGEMNIVHETSKWISVKDRLPDEEGIYLVYVLCNDGDNIIILFYTHEERFCGVTTITHWMPFPEDPWETD